MKKSKFNLFASIFQIVVGLAAIVFYILLAFSGEKMLRWTVTLLFAIYFLIIGIVDLIKYVKSKE